MKSNIPALPESELANLMKNRSLQSFEILYDKYAPSLYGLIFNVTGNEQVTTAILQASFNKIWDNYHRYDPTKTRLFTWVYAITCSIAHSHNIVLISNSANGLACATCRKDVLPKPFKVNSSKR